MGNQPVCSGTDYGRRWHYKRLVRRARISPATIQKIKLFVSEQRAEAAKAMVRSVATQDKDLYEKLRKELENELDPQQYKDIFGDYPDIKPR